MNRPERAGLDAATAARRLADEGPNEVGPSRRRSLLAILRDVASEPMFLLLLGAGTIYLLVGDRFEAMVLTGFVLLIIGITVLQERRTDNTLAALRELSSPRALVLRDGRPVRIAGREVVRGDVLLLGEGDRVPADGHLLDAHDLALDEAMLTGESLPVAKSAGDTVSAGTLVVQGQGMVLVDATGARTDMGRIGQSLDTIAPQSSPLRAEMARLTRRVALAGGMLAGALSLAYWVLRGSLPDALLAGIALAMSLLPQEFPVIMIIFFAFAARRLARQQVLTRRLDAIETLGETSVLCVDKTGTLTRNRMQVVALHPGPSPDLAHCAISGPLSPGQAALLHHALLASETEPHDPMEKAIHELAARVGDAARAGPGWQLVREYELSPALPAMTHGWHAGGAGIAAVKGAPEAVAALCRLPADAARQIAQAAAALAGRGLRVLGVARAGHDPALPWPDTQQGFAFEWLGLLALADPLREDVPAAIAECLRAGIRVVMITGDHPRTALAIAHEAGIPATQALTGAELAAMDGDRLARAARELNVFARVRPEQKLALVESLKRQSEVVAMTGDGVNDAPALKAAHIGIAMGQRGTDVAREAGALVLLTDEFQSIVQAVRAGRRTFANMRQALVYTVAVHLPIVALAALPLLSGLPLLLAPLHIAFLELVIDPACSIVFEAEEGDGKLMQQPPRRPGEPLLSARSMLQSLAWGALTACAAFGSYAWLLASGRAPEAAAACAFIVLVTGNALLILPGRSARPEWRALWTGLPKVSLGVIAGTLAALWLVTQVEAVARLFRFAPPDPPAGIASVLAGVALLPLFQLTKRMLSAPADPASR